MKGVQIVGASVNLIADPATGLSGSGFRVCGRLSGFRRGLRVAGFRVLGVSEEGFGFRVSEFTISELGLGLRIRVYGFGFQARV